MRISLNWLNDYIAVKNIAPEVIAEALTDLGLEVEGIETIAPVQGQVVVGKVLETTPHPDADKLKVCQVETGSGEPLEIVCGAANARAGIKVCVATVGSVLPGDFKIKKSKIRGVASQGMLCSAAELGVGSDHSGIVEVNSDVDLGTLVADLYSLNDTVLELGLTPNRADCLGYIGVARDLSAKLGIPLKTPSLDDLDIDDGLQSSSQISIEVEDAADCPRFCALYLDGVSTEPAPAWMQRRLTAAGMRPINLLVDVTNYVMLEYGQPIHAYDHRDLSGNTIRVRRAKDGEELTTLDGEKRRLSPSDLLICDGEGPVGLAGVMGGLNSEVKDDTSAIVIEVASFDGGLIRRTGKRLALHTEASHRFERGTDLNVLDQIAYRAAGLIQQSSAQNEQARVRIAGSIAEFYPEPWQSSLVAIRTSRCRQILGATTLTPQDVTTALEALQFAMVDKTEDGERMLFQIPSWRRDIFREIDLIEEVGRQRGYDKLPYSLPMMEIGPLPENPFIDFVDQVRMTCAQTGLNETISLPFIGQKDLIQFRIAELHPFAYPVRLANPLAEDEGYMQPMLAINLVKALARNRRHGVRGSRLFEIGRGYLSPVAMRESSGQYLDHIDEIGGHLSSRAKDETRAVEHNYAATIIDQPWREKSWNTEAKAATLFHGKALVETWLSGFSIGRLTFDPIGDTLLPYLHPAVAALVCIDEVPIGYLGELHPEVAVKYDFDPASPPIIAEINLERLYLAKVSQPKYQTDIRRFPPVTLDLAFIVDEKTTHAHIEAAFARFNRRKHLTTTRLFDVYQGDNVASGKKSMAYSLQFQSPKKTLSDKEVEKELESLKDWLQQEVGAQLR